MRAERRVLAFAAVAAIATLAALPVRLTAQAAPAGATFKCKDGTYSTAATSRGACSKHGGVGQALTAVAAAPTAPAPVAHAAAAAGAPPAGATFKCTDGTYSTAATSRGACSKHGGVAQALGAAPAAPAAAPAAPAVTPTVPAPTARAAAPTARAAAPTGAAPATATALCKDGTYSSSQHRSGTCSRHGGVQQWLHQPPN